MEYVLQVDHLTKQYKHFKALDDLSMRVPKGAIYGFVGKNGAGKTTLIRVVCALQNPTSGEYRLYGRARTDRDIARSRRRMGAIIETPAVYRDMTAEENLRAQYRVLGRPSEDGIGELLELVGLGDTGKKKAKDFSLGMLKRLGIAVALAGDPDFLMLDEPTGGLDPQGIVELRELILRLNRERQITVLISSHILDELSRLATHYGFIDRGRLVREVGAKEMETACRKCARLTVSDVRALSRVLDALGVEYAIISDHEADVFGAWNVTQVTLALAREGCEVRAIAERNESLESYYINLIGGGAHA